MKMVLRSVGGIAAGLAVSIVLVVATEFFGALAHPFPEGFGGTPEEVRAHVERFPAWVLGVVVALWGLAAFAGVWTAGRLGGRACGVFVGLLLLAGVILNVSMLPYPVWFTVGALLAVPAASVGALRSRVLGPRRSVDG